MQGIVFFFSQKIVSHRQRHRDLYSVSCNYTSICIGEWMSFVPTCVPIKVTKNACRNKMLAQFCPTLTPLYFFSIYYTIYCVLSFGHLANRVQCQLDNGSNLQAKVVSVSGPFLFLRKFPLSSPYCISSEAITFLLTIQFSIYEKIFQINKRNFDRSHSLRRMTRLPLVLWPQIIYNALSVLSHVKYIRCLR